ncbi:hypothetical protein C8R48DRAFT_775267 [Suillus tomentosus]|nr:hypothetical protein C8R48DRAFT_775267 [Suillus tomentosus]
MPPLLNPDAPVRAKRVPAPSKRLTDAANTATPELSTHLEAVNLKQASAPPTTVPATSHSVSSSSEEDSDYSATPKRPQMKSLILFKSLLQTQKMRLLQPSMHARTSAN